jgi:hypothetical protein
MTKTIAIVVAAVAMLAAGALTAFGVINTTQLMGAWAVFGPVILASLGLQAHDNAAEIKEMKAQTRSLYLDGLSGYSGYKQ